MDKILFFQAMDDPFLRQLQLQSRKIFMADIFHIISLLLLGKYRSEVGGFVAVHLRCFLAPFESLPRELPPLLRYERH